MKYPRNQHLLPFARELRKNMTKEERRLWFQCLRYVTPRFRRQEIVGNYIIDFFCYESALAIELDGSQHYDEQIAEEDEARTQYLRSLGITVLRFSNLDVLQNFTGVCEQIEETMRTMSQPMQFDFPD